MLLATSKGNNPTEMVHWPFSDYADKSQLAVGLYDGRELS